MNSCASTLPVQQYARQIDCVHQFWNTSARALRGLGEWEAAARLEERAETKREVRRYGLTDLDGRVAMRPSARTVPPGRIVGRVGALGARDGDSLRVPGGVGCAKRGGVRGELTELELE